MVIDSASPESIHETVREHYAAAAVRASRGDCCAPGDEPIGSELYSALDRSELPDAAVLASLGCGNPTAVADLHEGERVLDLGSGGGIDVLLSARRVGPTGRAFGLDMTDEMLALAQRNAAEAKATNVEFLKGHIEAIPLPADSIDVVISNCVVNLAADKPSVFREIARVLRPGGRIGISDIVAEDRLSPAERFERGSYAGCIAGALSISEFREGLEAVGMTDISITPDARRRGRDPQRDHRRDQTGGRGSACELARRAFIAGRVRGVLLMQVERAGSDDLGAIERLLVASGLPLDGARDAFATGVVAREGGEVVGAAAIEPYGPAGLLRSVVVEPTVRGTGIGASLVESSEILARDLGINELYLLTETAETWFENRGYRAIGRDVVPEPVRGSIEFTTACSTTAVAMRRALGT